MAAELRAGGPLPRLLVLGGAVLWGTTGTTQALGAPAADPGTVGALRLAVGAISLVVLAVAAGRGRSLAGLARPGARLAALVGAAAIAAYQVLFFEGVARTGVAVGTIVGIGSAPVFTGLVELVVRRVRPERVWAISTALAVAGCVLLAASGGEETVVDPLGIVLALGAGASYAVFTVATKHLLDRGCGPFETMAGTFGAGTVVLLPLFAGGDFAWAASGRGLLAVLWLGVATVGVGYALYATGLRSLPAASVATLTLGEPLTAGLLGWLVLGERLEPLGSAGVVAVVAGLAVLALRPGQPRAGVTARRGSD